MEATNKESVGRKHFIQLTGYLLLMACLTGCAFSRTQVKINFSPVVENQLKAAHTNRLKIGTIKDSRLVTDEFVLIHKSNAYGATSGAYITDVPVAKIFQSGLQAALAQNGFTDGKQDEYKLNADLRGFGFGVIQGGLFNLTGKPWMEIRFELDDGTTGQPVWHDTYTGQSTQKLSSWDGANQELLVKMFSQVAEDAIKQLVADKTFRSFFEK